MLLSQIILSIFISIFLFSLGLIYLYFKNQRARDFGYATLFFLNGAFFLFACYMLELGSYSSAFWSKMIHVSTFLMFYTFPRFTFALLDRKLKPVFSWILLTMVLVITGLILFTETILTSTIEYYSGRAQLTKTGIYYIFVIILIFFASYLIWDFIKYIRKTQGKILFNIKPVIVGVILCLIFAIIDVAGLLLGKPVFPSIRDPFIFGLFALLISFAISFLSRYTIIFANLSRSKEKIEKLIAKTNKNFQEFVELIAKTLDAKDQYTAGHSLRVAEYAEKIAHALNLPDNDIKSLKQACLLHDIGKIGIPDGILNKKSKLNNKEIGFIKNHPILGKKILGTVSDFSRILNIVYHHHERVDGQGYPDGLIKNEIPLLARIIAVADTYDAMTSERPYRKARSKKEAIEELKKIKGIQLDEKIVDLFLQIIKQEDTVIRQAIH